MGHWCTHCHEIFDRSFDLEKMQCRCGSFDLVVLPDDLSITLGELFTIAEISKDKTFCQAMIDLKLQDPIEYQLKLSQFKAQIEQQKAENDKIKCPKCGSTNITTGQRGFKLTTGFLGSGKTINRCGNCGYSWKPKN